MQRCVPLSEKALVRKDKGHVLSSSSRRSTRPPTLAKLNASLVPSVSLGDHLKAESSHSSLRLPCQNSLLGRSTDKSEVVDTEEKLETL